jgi:hypothetical protein
MYEHSNCHNAPVTIGGEDSEETEEGQTHYWICTVCDRACDIH